MNDDDRFPLGSKWVIRETPMNAKNGLEAGATAYLTFKDATDFTIESLQSGMPMRRIRREAFAVNFSRALDGAVNAGYAGSAHAPTLYYDGVG